MKFSKLLEKFEKLVKKKKRGKNFKSEKVKKLQRLLRNKESHYKAKLKATKDPEERRKLNTRLKVVDAQLKKSNRLLK